MLSFLQSVTALIGLDNASGRILGRQQAAATAVIQSGAVCRPLSLGGGSWPTASSRGRERRRFEVRVVVPACAAWGAIACVSQPLETPDVGPTLDGEDRRSTAPGGGARTRSKCAGLRAAAGTPRGSCDAATALLFPLDERGARAPDARTTSRRLPAMPSPSKHGSGPPLPARHRQPPRHVGSGGRAWRASAASSRSTSRASPAPRRAADPSPAGLTTYLERWFAEQGLDRPHVAGNSLGGGHRPRARAPAAPSPRPPASPPSASGPRASSPSRSARCAPSRAIVRRLRPAMPGADAHGRRARRALLADLRAAVAPAARRCGDGRRRLPRRPGLRRRCSRPPATTASARATSCAACR